MASRAFAAVFAAVALVVCSSVLPRVLASDPSQLQDFCVADKLSAGIYIQTHFINIYVATCKLQGYVRC